MTSSTIIIQTVFDHGTVYGVDTERMMLSVDQPEQAIDSLWQIIENRGLIAVADADFTRSVSFHPSQVLSLQVLS